MTSLPVSTSRQTGEAGRALRRGVGRSATRGVVLAMLGGLMLTAAGFAFLLLLLVAVDAFAPLPAAVRWAGLVLLVLLTLGAAGVLVVLPLLNQKRLMGAAEHIEVAAGASDQPVVRGLTLRDGGADAFTEALCERAKQRAADLSESVQPRQAYPASALRRQGRWLWLSCIGWLVLAIVFPSQLLGVFTRTLTPWVSAPPFSLTQLEPQWSPKPPVAGEDVSVTAVPEGVAPGGVDLLRLAEDGAVVERLAMTADGQGGFRHTLRHIDRAVTFKLEANGRATKAYTIEPTLKPPAADTNAPDANTDSGNPGGTTQFDADAVTVRDSGAQALRDRVDKLLAALADVEARAGSIDPADMQAARDLAGDISALSAEAAELAGELERLQSRLPDEAAASLSALQAALAQLQSAQLQPATGSGPADWLSQAAQAARNDQAQIGQGVGASVLPAASGTSSGGPDGTTPDFNDPQAAGGYDEQGVSGGDGPLPPAVMQQVPPSYRKLITAYFNKLAEQGSGDDENEPGEAP